ncbi:MAG TPA: hypothetical protein VNE83_00590 [Terriglobales bacterium]|nr:hypothetical protein [Terriglobales bacterium]
MAHLLYKEGEHAFGTACGDALEQAVASRIGRALYGMWWGFT